MPVFQTFLEGFVVKFFAEIRLQMQGLMSFAAFQNTLKGVGDTFARLVFQRDRPRVFGEHVHDRQDEAVPLIPFLQGGHVHQIGDPLFVAGKHDHGHGGKLLPTPSKVF